jgi:3-phosphoshikimate 1-carboxyvinyltransferase
MRERPIGDLLATLSQLGARAFSETNNACPPVILHASGLTGGGASVRGDVSSQFLSGLLMALPYAREAIELHVTTPLVSQPYVAMTLRVMESFGISCDSDGLTSFRFPGRQRYRGYHYEIEPDASAASYFWGAAIETYNDHRMAMSLALAGLRIPGVVINDPGCVAKTYPRFFEDFAKLT